MYQQVKWHTHTLWQFGVNHQSQTMGGGQILENPHSSSQNVRLSSHSLPYEIVVQSHSHIWLFVTPWTEAHQASLPFTISLSLLKLMSIELVMPSNHFLLYLSFYSCSQLFPALGTVKKAECQRIDGFGLWCWRRLPRVPWTARRSNQSILKEIRPEYSLKEWC